MPNIIIHDLSTDEITIREMTPEEIDPSLIWTDEQKEQAQAQAQAKAEAAAQRQALLDKLGITEDEAKLLLS